MAYSKISAKLSGYLIEELNYPEEKRDVLSYSLDTLFLFVSGYVIVLFIGWFIGIPGAVLCTLLSGDILRKFSGGFHLSTPYRCLTTTTVVYTSVSWLSVQAYLIWGKETIYNYILLILYIICLVLVSKYAPVDNPAKPIVSSSFRKKLKTASILVVILLGVLVILFKDKNIASLIIGGMVIQSVALLPFRRK